MRLFSNFHKTKSKYQYDESGQGMVEMLGVLAVIGVLSIVGIAGYNAAMSKYQANKVANELNLISNQIKMLMEQKTEGQYELSLGALYEDGVLAQSGYEFAFGCGSDSCNNSFFLHSADFAV